MLLFNSNVSTGECGVSVEVERMASEVSIPTSNCRDEWIVVDRLGCKYQKCIVFKLTRTLDYVHAQKSKNIIKQQHQIHVLFNNDNMLLST